MNIVEAIRIALQSLWANKLRSVLSTLAIVIGVAAVIAVVTFVAGIDGYVAGKIFNLGADVFIMSKFSPVETNVDHFLDARETQRPRPGGLSGRARSLPATATTSAPPLRNSTGHVKYAEQSISDTTVQGITPSMAPIYDTDLSAGRMLTETDLENKSPVVVVGTDIVEHLMPGVDPLGREIRLDGWTYPIVGVGKKKGKTLGQSLDNYVMIPITAYLKQYGVHNRQHPDFRESCGGRSLAQRRQSTKRAWRCALIGTTVPAPKTVSISRPTPACSASGRISAAHSSWLRSAWLPSRWSWAASSS